LSCLEACTQVYPVYKIPIVAPGPTSGDAANPQVGPTYLFPARLF
jgi:hypothetical protein